MRKTTFLFVVCLSALTAAAQQPVAQEFNFAANQSVYVIAVKTPLPQDPSIWMQLHRNNTRPPGFIHGPASSRNDSERATLERTPSERTTLERETPLRRALPPTEPQLKKLIEEEFLKQKKFRLADSPETADFIFFAHGEYTFSFIQTNGRGGGVVLFGASGQGDTSMELNTLARLNLAAIPVAEYRQWKSEIADLLEKAKWREVAWGEVRSNPQFSYQEPPTKKLIQQFHKQALKK